MRLFITIIILFTIGCHSSVIENENFSIGEEFTLNFGQEKKLSGGHLSVKFDSVLSDSRCPIDGVCVWEGEAQIRLKLTFSTTGDYEYAILKIKGYVNRENKEQHQFVFARYFVIYLMQLDPYPVHNVPLDFEKYKALLTIRYVER